MTGMVKEVPPKDYKGQKQETPAAPSNKLTLPLRFPLITPKREFYRMSRRAKMQPDSP